MARLRMISPARIRGRVTDAVAECRKLGCLNAIKLSYCQATAIAMKDFGIRGWRSASRLTPKTLEHPIWVRGFTSDVYVARQSLMVEEHRPVGGLKNVTRIIDCGANVGFASAYFLSRYPEAKVVAIEPDPANYEALCRNLAPYGNRATCLRAAIWGERATLSVSRNSYRDGLDWSTTVVPAKDQAAADTEGLTIPDVMERVGWDHIDLLKIDVEGAELELFRGDAKSWLTRTSHLCIELHGEQCEAAFHSAIADFDCEKLVHDELVICLGLSAREPSN